MFKKSLPYALVLSGGGAKGAYEIGAWKALKELGIKFNAVCGASVGALNAAIIAQDDIELGMKLWSEMTIDKVVDIPPELLENGKPKLTLKNITKIGDLNLNIKNLGLDPAPLHNLLKNEINETKIRKSGIDLGIITLNVDNLKPFEIFIDAMPNGTLADYLLASASFPAFKRAEINGKQFTDGGVYDNIPHSMVKNRGYRRIIVIDIDGIGNNRKPDITGTDTIYIKTTVPLCSVLDFDPDKALTAIEAGYLDTMKVFEKYHGQKYFIKRNKKIEKEYWNRLFKPENIEKYSKYLKLENKTASPENVEELIRDVLPKEQKNNKELLICLLESAAGVLDLERIKLYTTEELIEAIKNKYSEIMQSASTPTKSESESFFKRIEDTIEETLNLFRSDKDSSNYCPYEYAKILKGTKATDSLFPELAPAEIFFSIL
ncbi:MAG: patatin-like phospholipase family protein [Spirochaetales bacterium]|nr:patatin-like phospholipase family protein [Spirochaetales bacterium]